MSVQDKITRLATARDDIRTALVGKEVSAANNHGFSSFASDINNIPVRDPDDYALIMYDVSTGEEIEPDSSECFLWTNLQIDGTTSGIFNTTLHLFSSEYPEGFKIEMDFDNVLDESTDQYRRIFSCEKSASPYPGLNLTRKQNTTDVAVLSLYNSNGNEIEFQLLATGNTVSVEYNAESGAFTLTANGQTVTGTVTPFDASDTLFTLGGQFWSGGTSAADGRCAKVKINELVVSPRKTRKIANRGWVYIGKSTTSLSSNLFPSNTSGIMLPLTIKTMNSYCLSNLKNLKHLFLPGVETIAGNAFENCFRLKTFIAPKCTSISYSAFVGCGALEHVELPLITSAGLRMFKGFSNLKYLDIRSATSIGNQVCQYCSNLETVIMPSAVTFAANNNFSNCGKLNIDINMPNLETLSSSFMNTAIQKVKNLGKLTTLDGSFKGCSQLTFVRLPSTLTNIKDFAFENVGNNITLICEATTPPSCTSGCFNYNRISAVYVPDASLSSYILASQWTVVATKMHPLSEYTGTD